MGQSDSVKKTKTKTKNVFFESKNFFSNVEKMDFNDAADIIDAAEVPMFVSFRVGSFYSKI